MKKRPAISVKQGLLPLSRVGLGDLGSLLQTEPRTLDKSYPFNPIPCLVLWVYPSCYQLTKPSSATRTIAFSTSPCSAYPLPFHPQLCFIFPQISYYKLHYILLPAFQKAPRWSILFTEESIASRALLVTNTQLPLVEQIKTG